MREKLYLVRETKGTLDEAERRATENMKIACARQHFSTLKVDYNDIVVTEKLRREMLLQENSLH